MGKETEVKKGGKNEFPYGFQHGFQYGFWYGFQ
jgi:hypothetical protein